MFNALFGADESLRTVIVFALSGLDLRCGSRANLGSADSPSSLHRLCEYEHRTRLAAAADSDHPFRQRSYLLFPAGPRLRSPNLKLKLPDHSRQFAAGFLYLPHRRGPVRGTACAQRAVSATYAQS